jgi:hypothetical protein
MDAAPSFIDEGTFISMATPDPSKDMWYWAGWYARLTAMVEVELAAGKVFMPDPGTEN